ncbi:MAG: dihydrofolate reductase [Bacteroidales bacterium]|nr:dihydrofolate reductase [Bacteroidales bacterium]
MNTYTIIVAVGDNNAIGQNGDLLWHIHEDMVFFRNTTRGFPVIMGRKTWDSLQVKPLPKRKNYVVTSNKDFCFDGVEVFHSLDELKSQLPDTNQEHFIIGGGSIYKALLPMCSRLVLTRVYHTFPQADTFFPEIKEEEWELVEESELKTDEESGLQFRFQNFKRR